MASRIVAFTVFGNSMQRTCGRFHRKKRNRQPMLKIALLLTPSAYPGTVLPGQYSSTLSSTVLLLFVHTSVETRFLYELKAVVLQSCKAFPGVPMVQRAALRAIWKGSLGRSSTKKVFFFITPFFLPDLSFFCRPPFCVFCDLHFTLSHDKTGKDKIRHDRKRQDKTRQFMARHYLWWRVGIRVLVLLVCERERGW